jgi:hypothetical protein
MRKKRHSGQVAAVPKKGQNNPEDYTINGDAVSIDILFSNETLIQYGVNSFFLKLILFLISYSGKIAQNLIGINCTK